MTTITRQELLDVLSYINLQSIYITDDHSCEMQEENAAECAHMEELLVDLEKRGSA